MTNLKPDKRYWMSKMTRHKLGNTSENTIELDLKNVPLIRSEITQVTKRICFPVFHQIFSAPTSQNNLVSALATGLF